MTLANLVKRLEDIMRSDTGIDGTAQRLSQIVWLLFLKAFDYTEKNAELEEDDYKPVIPVGYRWRDWATAEDEDERPNPKNQRTGDALITFVNTELLPVLRGEAIKVGGKDVTLFASEDARALLVKDFMRRTNNYSQNGIQLRLMVNLFDEVDFDEVEDTHEFNDVYEEMLKSLQSAGRAGEFYTPRALTSFGIRHIDPRIGDQVADFSCGTGGFLVDAYRYLRDQIRPGDIEAYDTVNTSLHGQEWKPLPYMLCVTNLMLKGIPLPDIQYGDSLSRRLSDYGREDQVQRIAMNPPYGGVALDVDKQAFPADVRSSETYDLFMSLIIKRLADGGKAVVILPDGFLEGNGVKATIKRHLMTQCNLHTIIRLPQSCFAPYTPIPTNMLFFDKGTPTHETWFYRVDMPEGYKHFSKTKPLLSQHLEEIDEWWDKRTQLFDGEGQLKAMSYTYDEIAADEFNLDLCGYVTKTPIVLNPEDAIRDYLEHREYLDAKIDVTVSDISNSIDGTSEKPLLPLIEELDQYAKRRVKLDSSFPSNMKSSVILAAVQGKLTKQRATDEPSSTLLKRRGKSPLYVEDEPFELPNGWCWAHFSDIADLERGAGIKRSEVTEYGEPCVRYGELYTTYDQEIGKVASHTTDDVYDRSHKLAPDEVLMTLTGENDIDIGCAVFNNTGRTIAYGGDLLALKNHCMDGRYLMYAINSDYIREQRTTNASGKIIVHLSGKKIGQFVIAVPPLAEQQRIVAKLDELLPKTEKLGKLVS